MGCFELEEVLLLVLFPFMCFPVFAFLAKMNEIEFVSGPKFSMLFNMSKLAKHVQLFIAKRSNCGGKSTT